VGTRKLAKTETEISLTAATPSASQTIPAGTMYASIHFAGDPGAITIEWTGASNKDETQASGRFWTRWEGGWCPFPGGLSADEAITIETANTVLSTFVVVREIG